MFLIERYSLILYFFNIQVFHIIIYNPNISAFTIFIIINIKNKSIETIAFIDYKTERIFIYKNLIKQY